MASPCVGASLEERSGEHHSVTCLSNVLYNAGVAHLVTHVWPCVTGFVPGFFQPHARHSSNTLRSMMLAAEESMLLRNIETPEIRNHYEGASLPSSSPDHGEVK